MNLFYTFVLIPDVKLGMQETQLSTSSPMVMGHPLGEPVPQSLEISRDRE